MATLEAVEREIWERVYRGNGVVVGRDLQLGNLRDSYYQAEYGTLTTKPTNVVRLDRASDRRATKSPKRKP